MKRLTTAQLNDQDSEYFHKLLVAHMSPYHEVCPECDAVKVKKKQCVLCRDSHKDKLRKEVYHDSLPLV